MTDNNAINTIKQTISRNEEINHAKQAFPGLEIGEAYLKWKTARGETPEIQISSQTEKIKIETAETLKRLRERTCTKENCPGTQILEGICGGCIEGQAGYKTKWTCQKCLHRDLYREDLNSWLNKLSTEQKA